MDDPDTTRIAHDKATDHPGRVIVCPYPEDTDVHNKPIGLNAAVRRLEHLGVRFECIGVADAEDLFHQPHRGSAWSPVSHTQQY